MLPSQLPDEWAFFIYRVVCNDNKKVYIGLTRNSPVQRWGHHKRDAKKGSNLHFHRAIRKYGEEAFTLSVVAVCKDLKDARITEKALVRQYDSFNKGYNSTIGGEGCLGFKMPEKHMERLKEFNKGRLVSEETREKIRQGNLGKVHTKEAKEKCRVAGLKRRTTDEWREKIRNVALRQVGKLHFYNPEIGYFFGYIKDLCDEFSGVSDSKITAVKNGRRNHHKKWVILNSLFNDMSRIEKQEEIERKQVLGSKVYGRLAA